MTQIGTATSDNQTSTAEHDKVIAAAAEAASGKTFKTQSHNCKAGSPSILTRASNESSSAPALLRETDVCFLHILDSGTNVRSPKMQSRPPDGDFESRSFPVNHAS